MQLGSSECRCRRHGCRHSTSWQSGISSARRSSSPQVVDCGRPRFCWCPSSSHSHRNWPWGSGTRLASPESSREVANSPRRCHCLRMLVHPATQMDRRKSFIHKCIKWRQFSHVHKFTSYQPLGLINSSVCVPQLCQEYINLAHIKRCYRHQPKWWGDCSAKVHEYLNTELVSLHSCNCNLLDGWLL